MGLVQNNVLRKAYTKTCKKDILVIILTIIYNFDKNSHNFKPTINIKLNQHVHHSELLKNLQ